MQLRFPFLDPRSIYKMIFDETNEYIELYNTLKLKLQIKNYSYI